MKTCPFCAGEIQDAAVVCKHCRSALTAIPAGPPVTVQPSQWPGVPVVQEPARTNRTAVAALVTGVLFLPIVPIILGHISKKEIDESQGRQTGRGMAVAGIVLGWIQVTVFLVCIRWA